MMKIDTPLLGSIDNCAKQNKVLVCLDQKSQVLGKRLKNYPNNLDFSQYDEFMRNELGILNDMHVIFSQDESTESKPIDDYCS